MNLHVHVVQDVQGKTFLLKEFLRLENSLHNAQQTSSVRGALCKLCRMCKGFKKILLYSTFTKAAYTMHIYDKHQLVQCASK